MHSRGRRLNLSNFSLERELIRKGDITEGGTLTEEIW